MYSIVILDYAFAVMKEKNLLTKKDDHSVYLGNYGLILLAHAAVELRPDRMEKPQIITLS